GVWWGGGGGGVRGVFLLVGGRVARRIAGPLRIGGGSASPPSPPASFLPPPLALRIYPHIPFITAAIGEGALLLWLIVKGVNVERWQEQAVAMNRAGWAPASE